MSAKILISGQSNSGKTTLLSSLKDVLVISHDGKSYPFPQPHVNVASFGSSAELIKLISEKIHAYKAKFGAIPKTLAIDSVSKIFDTLMDNCNTKYTGFNVYSNLNKEIYEFTDFIQNSVIASGMNVVLISHAIWDADTAQFTLVGKGDFGKRGGFLSEVDHSVFVETKNNKRIIHHRSTRFPARTTLADLPDSQPIEEYTLQKHVDILTQLSDQVADYEL